MREGSAQVRGEFEQVRGLPAQLRARRAQVRRGSAQVRGRLEQLRGKSAREVGGPARWWTGPLRCLYGVGGVGGVGGGLEPPLLLRSVLRNRAPCLPSGVVLPSLPMPVSSRVLASA